MKNMATSAPQARAARARSKAASRSPESGAVDTTIAIFLPTSHLRARVSGHLDEIAVLVAPGKQRRLADGALVDADHKLLHRVGRAVAPRAGRPGDVGRRQVGAAVRVRVVYDPRRAVAVQAACEGVELGAGDD